MYVIPRIGGQESKVVDVVSPELPSPMISWSPDSSSLVVADRSDPSEPFGLFLVSLETGEKRRLTRAPTGYDGDTVGAISPDGTRLAITRRLRHTVSELHLLELGPDLVPESEPTVLAPGVWRANAPT